MAARILDGRSLAQRLRERIEPQVAAFRQQQGRPPGLGIVLVRNDPASEVYVRNKVRAGTEIGFRVDLERLADTAKLREVVALVERWNRSDVHDGILVQSPLPSAMGVDAEQQVFDTIAVEKDVDGFSPASVGRLVQKRAVIAAGTPSGVIELLVSEGIEIAGRHAVVIGRSDIVGKPMALLLLHRDATVTICHSRTRDLSTITRQADILVAAVGRPGFVTPDFVKPGAVVVDVGVNRVTDASLALELFGEGHPRLALFRERGSILVGDVAPRVAAVAGALTPVPGGVGPLTIAMLMKNTLAAAETRVASGA